MSWYKLLKTFIIFYRVSLRGGLIIKGATCHNFQVVSTSGSSSTLLSLFFELSFVQDIGSTEFPGRVSTPLGGRNYAILDKARKPSV